MQRSSSRNVHGKTNLSRAAVSHYLQILKDAGILKMRRECTKNYYYFDADAEAMNFLINMPEHAKQFMEKLPDRSGKRIDLSIVKYNFEVGAGKDQFEWDYFLKKRKNV